MVVHTMAEMISALIGIAQDNGGDFSTPVQVEIFNRYLGETVTEDICLEFRNGEIVLS